MRKLVVCAIGARTALRLVVPVALVATGALTAVPAAAAARAAAPSSCTVRWVGKATQPMWTIASNWSTGKVPGPADDVCIDVGGVDVLTPVSITIHSLELGPDAGIALEGTASKHVTATVATSVTMHQGVITRIDLAHGTIKAPKITDLGGTIFTDGNCDLASPDIAFSGGADVQAANGTTTLASLTGLSNGTLTGASFQTDNATVVLPGDITHLASANLSVGPGSAIDDPAGHNALTRLTSVDAQSSLTDANNLTLAGGSFTASGNITVNGATLAVGGPFTQAQGTLLLGESAILSASTVTIDQGASLTDGGTITTNLVNDGTVQASGTAQVTGDYTQATGATLVTGFGGLLAVTGMANLSGSVLVSELLTHTGDTTRLITFGSLHGGFTSPSLGLRLFTKANEIDAIVIPQLAVSPATVAPGGTVTVNGGGFTYPETARIFLDQVGGTPLGSSGIGIHGTFTATVTIPAATAAGPHRLIAVENDGKRASIAIKVS